MVKNVVKQDKRKEIFIPEKIVVSALKAGANPESARKVAIYIEGTLEDEVDTSEIKRIVLEKLSKENPDLKKNWLNYEKIKKTLGFRK